MADELSDDERERAKAIKQKLEEKEDLDRKDFTVYDMPTELANKYISMAKLYYDNEVWRVLEHGMELMVEEHTTRTEELEERVKQLEAKVSTLEATQEPEDVVEDDDNDIPPTFGGDDPDVEVAEELEELEEL